jgi:hypothetical protein
VGSNPTGGANRGFIVGLFCLNMKNTIEDDVKCAIGNLELFLQDDCKKRSSYLLVTFAQKQINDALKKLEEQEDE